MDELLFLDLPRECRFPSGLMMLEYEKAVQESVYEKLRVVREGHLRIIYTHDLKILSWEFCSQHHEELLPRTFFASQFNQLVHAARMRKSTDGGSVSVVVAPEDLQANCETFLVAGSQLARTLDLQLVDDLGFANRYTQCLQIAEIVNIMKDLMTFSRNNNMGPIESLKNYSQETTTMKLRKEELEEKEGVGSAQGLPTDKDKMIAASTAPGSNVNESLVMTNGVHLTSSEQGALVLPDYYHKLLRQNSLTFDVGEVKQQSYSPYVSNEGAPFKPYNGPKTSSSGLIQNSPMDGLSSSHSLEGSQNKPDQAIQKILQEMVNNSRKVNGIAGDRVIREVGKSTVVDLPTRGKETDVVRNGLSSGNVAAPRNALGGTAGRISNSGTVFNRERSTPPWAASGTPPHLSYLSLRDIENKKEGKQQQILSHSPKTRMTGFSVASSQGSPSDSPGLNRWFRPVVDTPSSICSIQIEEKAIKDLKRFYSSVKIVKNQS